MKSRLLPLFDLAQSTSPNPLTIGLPAPIMWILPVFLWIMAIPVLFFLREDKYFSNSHFIVLKLFAFFESNNPCVIAGDRSPERTYREQWNADRRPERIDWDLDRNGKPEIHGPWPERDYTTINGWILGAFKAPVQRIEASVIPWTGLMNCRDNCVVYLFVKWWMNGKGVMGITVA